MSLQFANVWVLYLLWVVPLLAAGAFALVRRRQRALDAFLDPAMRARLAPPEGRRRVALQILLVSAALLLMLVAAARPQWGQREERVFQRGRDLLIALDVSRSMMAADVHPSRLGRAKVDLRDVIRELRGDRAGLIAFRGSALSLCPLTTDYAYLLSMLDSVGVESAPRGETDIGAAIRVAIEAFADDPGAHKAIILVSDGEDLAGRAEAAAQEARKQGIPIFTVGMGDPAGAPIPSPERSGETLAYEGKPVTTRLEHQTLRMIADTTGGAYVPVGVSNVRLGDLYRDHLSKLTVQDAEETQQRRAIERYQPFLLVAIVLLLAAGCMSRGQLAVRRPESKGPEPAKGSRRSPSPRRAGAATALLAFALGAHPAPAATPTNQLAAATRLAPAKQAHPVPSGRAGAQTAQRLYAAGQFQAAAEAYQQAADTAGGDLRDELLYNSGCALYRAGDYRAAAARFQSLSARAEPPAGSDYNLGCALYRAASSIERPPTNAASAEARAQLLRDAAAAFQKAVRAPDPEAHARDNLALAQSEIPAAAEEARLAALMERYGHLPPPQVADQLYSGQRAVAEDLAEALTNGSPSRIAALEGIARRQAETADIVTPLRASLGRSGSGIDPKQIAAAQQQLDSLQEAMTNASGRLRDLDPEGFAQAMRAAAGVYGLWKALAPYDALLREDIRRQSNSVVDTTRAAARPDELGAAQGEAATLTRLFAERFEQTVPKEGNLMVDTNTTPVSTNGISAETRARILELSGQAITAQSNSVRALQSARLAESLPDQKRAARLLREIDELLPRQKQPQPKQDESQQPPPENKDQQPQPDQPQPQPKPQEQQQEQADPSKDMSPRDAQQLIRRALQREKDHQNELKQKEFFVPLSPANRDW